MRTTRWIALVLLVIAVGWSGLWVYASIEAGRRFDMWQTAEAARGRIWTCPDRKIAGYPFGITIACENATFVGRGRDHVDTAAVSLVTATVTIIHPRQVALALRAPFSYRSSDGTSAGASSAIPATSVAANWATLEIDLADLPDLRTVELRGTDVSVDGVFGQSGQQDGRAATLSTRITMTEPSPDPTLDFAIAVGGTDLAPLDALFGDTNRVDIDLAGRLDRAELGEARTPEGIIEAWRQAGGRVTLDSSRIGRGPSVVTASGIVGLDDEHRPQGRLQAQFVGLGPVFQRYGINPGLVAAGSLLSALFGGGRTRTAAAPPGAINLPIDLRDGRLGIGPVTTSLALPVLY